jgi:hypothetical protein
MTITQTIPTAVLAALSDPDVCGYHDEDGPCDNCTGHAAHQLASGMSEAEVLAAIEAARREGVALRQAVEEIS